MISNVVWGWLCVVGSWLCFGSFAVPIKTKSVRDAQVDPLVFQSYKTFFALITSVVAFAYNPFYWSPWGILSGVSWVPAGVAAIIAVNCIGISLAQGIWSGLIIVVSFCWGTIFFHEELKSIPLSILGVALLIAGIIGMAISPLFFLEKKAISQEEKAPLKDSRTDTPAPESQQEKEDVSKQYVTLGKLSINKRMIGYSAAIFNGIWGGSVMSPMKIANQRGVPTGIEFVFSFATGAAIVNVTLLLFYSIYRLAVLKQSPPSFHFKVMLLPGSVSGMLWSCGNYLSIYAVLFLGQAVGYPSVQAALIVSGLWGIFYYRELSRKQSLLWLLGALVTLSGIILLSQMHVTKK